MCAFLSIEVNAQSKAKGVSAKVNGKLWKSDETNSSAVWDSIEQSLSIMAVKPETGEYLNFKLISVGNLYSKGFRVGEYYFSQKTNFLDNYSASAFYIASENSIPISGTKEDIQHTLVFVAQKLGVVGSWFAGLVATGISLFFALKHLHHEKKK